MSKFCLKAPVEATAMTRAEFVQRKYPGMKNNPLMGEESDPGYLVVYVDGCETWMDTKRFDSLFYLIKADRQYGEQPLSI